MSEQAGTPPGTAEPVPTPKTAAFLLTIFADLYRQEIAAEEDVHRTLPFFGTALGIIVGALAYAGNRLPGWSATTTAGQKAAFAIACLLLSLAFVEAGCVLVLLSRALTRHRYQRIGPETAICTRLAELQASNTSRGLPMAEQDSELLRDMRQAILESYAVVTPINRSLNEQRYKHRAWAAINLLGSLIFALLATTVIFGADKLGYLPKVIQ
jgi:hypothetical protein